MDYVSKRARNKEIKNKKYLEIYECVKNDMPWDFIAHKFGYKNVKSITSAYHLYIVPYIKSL